MVKNIILFLSPRHVQNFPFLADHKEFVRQRKLKEFVENDLPGLIEKHKKELKKEVKK